MSVEHITKVSVLGRSSFVTRHGSSYALITVYETTAGAGKSSDILTIDLDPVRCVIDDPLVQYSYLLSYRPYIVTW